jgi:hypothetical protein
MSLVFFAGALGLLGYLVSRAGWDKLAAAITQLGVGGALLVVLVGFLETLLDAVALQRALCGLLSLPRVLCANSTGAIINSLVPWEAGEVAKGAILGRQAPTTSTITAVVIWNYAFKLTRPIVSLVAAVTGALFWKAAPDAVVGVVLAANVLAFAPYAILRLVLRAGPARLLARVVSSIPSKRIRSSSLIARAQAVDMAVASFASTHRAEYTAVITSQLAARLFSFSALYVTARLVGYDYGIAEVALLYAGMNVADYVIAVLPTRIGVSEGVAFAIFQLYGLPPSAGVIIFLILRFKTLVSNGIPAAFALYWLEPSASA